MLKLSRDDRGYSSNDCEDIIDMKYSIVPWHLEMMFTPTYLESASCEIPGY